MEILVMKSLAFFGTFFLASAALIFAGESFLFFRDYPRFLILFSGASLLITAIAFFTDAIPEDPDATVDKRKGDRS